MSWFKREKTPLRPPEEGERNVRTEGLFEKCPGCQRVVWKKDLERNHSVCTKCGHHSKITARQRLDLLFDNQQWVEFDQGLRTSDPLEFRDRKSYKARLEQAYRVTGLTEAVINAEGRMGGYRLICSCMEYRFIGGSMGSVVGEKITRAIERALQTRQALVICSASGGAQNDGRVSVAHADGQDQLHPGSSGFSRASLHFPLDRSDDRGSHGQLCDAG